MTMHNYYTDTDTDAVPTGGVDTGRRDTYTRASGIDPTDGTTGRSLYIALTRQSFSTLRVDHIC